MAKNKIINKSSLIKMLNKSGIKRISAEALEEIERKTREEINELVEFLVQNLIIKGKKTLTRQDILEAIIEQTKEKGYPEI